MTMMRHMGYGVRSVDATTRSSPSVVGQRSTQRTPGDPYYESRLTIYAPVSLVGAEVRIYDMDNIPTGSLGTELYGVESCTTATYEVWGVQRGNTIWIQIMKSGYEEYGLSIDFPQRDTQFYAALTSDINA